MKLSGKKLAPIIFAFFTVLAASTTAIDFKVQKTSLDNGLTLLLLEDHHAPIVTIEIAYRVGTANERRGYTGITRVCEKISGYGTETFERGAITRLVRSGGGGNYSSTGQDMTRFGERVPVFLLDSVLIMEADRMQNIEITYEKLVLAKEAVAKQRRLEIEGTLYGPLNEELFNLQYRSHPYGNPLYGWPPDLENIGIDDVKAYYRKYFVPANAQIVLAGDFDAVELSQRVRDLFGKIISPPAPRNVTITEPEHCGERKGYIYDRSEVPAVACAYMVQGASKQELAALRVLNQIESQGESSRLYRELVGGADLAVAVGGGQIILRGPGMIFFWAIGNFDTPISDLEDLMHNQIDLLRTDSVTSAELAKAKNKIIADYYRSLGSVQSIAQTISFYEINRGGWENIGRGILAAGNVSASDVMDVAKKYLIAENRVVVIMRSSGGDEGSSIREQGE